MEEELVNMMDSILNLRRDLNKERTERKQNTEVLNRRISQCTCEIKCISQLHNLSGNVTVGFDFPECVDQKKVKSLESGLAEEKALRLMNEEKFKFLEKELGTLRNLVESSLIKQIAGNSKQSIQSFCVNIVLNMSRTKVTFIASNADGDFGQN
ncbi:hypothetical protein CHS0354_020482 [Potamilus streckersoni]|uniref:Uncharacterized protein n=1 Tax=Potamilus streckersoni TaxID=2493646 RepID=A0AAE0T035_9BIVA|nr:hypothetical protein CHS0354_020482 [Potamilus streckersoni]